MTIVSWMETELCSSHREKPTCPFFGDVVYVVDSLFGMHKCLLNLTGLQFHQLKCPSQGTTLQEQSQMNKVMLVIGQNLMDFSVERWVSCRGVSECAGGEEGVGRGLSCTHRLEAKRPNINVVPNNWPRLFHK